MLQRKRTIKNKLCFGFAALFAATFISLSSAQAACTNPAGGAGKIIYNADDEVMQYCDDTNWIAMGPVPGAGGAGCSTPAGTAGKLIYNADNSVMQYCDGASWVAMGPVDPTPTTNGLVAHWKFDESAGTAAVDSTGNTDNNGTLENGGTWATGIIGGAIQLDGTDDYIDFPNSNNAGGVNNSATYSPTTEETVTLTGWFYRTQENPSHYLFIAGYMAGLQYLAIEDEPGSDQLLRSMVRNSGPAANWFPNTNGTTPWDEWVHFAYVVEDRVGYKFYINGALDKTVTVADPDVEGPNLNGWGCGNPNGCTLGRFSSGGNTFAGLLDDFRVYNRELSATEVATLYAHGTATGDCTNPAGEEGKMIYNSDDNIMQYCNGIQWVGIGK